MNEIRTKGIHHIGLTVDNLTESASFFTNLLGWKEVKRRDDYPAIFVSDGNVMLTLWSIKERPAVAFNKNQNIGLHHLAFKVESEAALGELLKILSDNDIRIEFSPETLGDGPAKHMICYEPSGNRIEFVWPG